MKEADYKQSVKWMNLALRFLRLSMDPRKQWMSGKLEVQIADPEMQKEDIEEKQR